MDLDGVRFIAILGLVGLVIGFIMPFWLVGVLVDGVRRLLYEAPPECQNRIFFGLLKTYAEACNAGLIHPTDIRYDSDDSYIVDRKCIQSYWHYGTSAGQEERDLFIDRE